MDRHPTIDELLKRDPSADVVVIPTVDTSDADRASVEYSQHRTKLSTHRTALSTRRTEMSSRRTGMSFQRSRLSAERTLMSVIRTSLSLISFGFTIYQFLGRLMDQKLVSGAPHAARNFGQALVWLGVAMLIVGIVYHVQFMLGLRNVRQSMHDETLVHAESGFPVSFTLLVAVLLLGIGLVALLSLTFQVGPFH
ncbi:MAG TPA: DUF202 domain-containing protein [Rhizomicrobium sp.]|nr:DUF202 domain-containing protein [Rhizomicrobium sp.]